MLCTSATEKLKQNPGREEEKVTETEKATTSLPRRGGSAEVWGREPARPAFGLPVTSHVWKALWLVCGQQSPEKLWLHGTLKDTQGSLTPSGRGDTVVGATADGNPPACVRWRQAPCFVAWPLQSGERPSHSHRETRAEGKGRTILPQL